MSATMPHTEKIAQLEKRILKLEAALEQLVEMGDYVFKPHEFAEIAEKALRDGDGRTAARA